MGAKRWICCLSLMIAFLGTPCRLVEAAHDAARAMAERAEDGGVAEVDGGVGDDALEAVQPGVDDLQASPVAWAEIDRAAGTGLPAWFAPGGRLACTPTLDPGWPPGQLPRRQAWLRRFLI